MAEGNGETKAPGIPEGDRFLVIRLSEKGEFSMMFSDLFAAHTLHRMAGIQLEDGIRANLAPAVPAIATPAIGGFPTLDRLRGRGRG